MKSKWIFIGIIFSSLLITIVWFRDGRMLATGEEGMPFYNPVQTVKLFSSSWVSTGTGYPMPVLLPRVAFFYPVSLVYKLTNSIVVTQALTAFALLVCGWISFYLLTKELTTPDYSNSLLAFFASVFYVFNQYSMTQIWSRFLFTGIVAWATIPLFTLGSIRYLRSGSLSNLLLYIIASLLSTSAFGAPSWVITFWLLTFVFLVTHFTKLIHPVKSLVVLVLVWVCINLWWIVPYAKLNSQAFSEVGGFQSSYGTVVSLSKFFTIPDLILLREAGGQPKFIISELVLFSIALVGALHIKKNSIRWYVWLIFFIGLFVSKATNPPFGKLFFYTLFKYVPASTVFRNPFEKFGLVYVMAYSIFFAVGIIHLSPVKKALSFILMFSVTLPLLTGSVFSNSLKVRVPDYVKQTNMELEDGLGRVFMLPFSLGEGVRYSWGYRGGDPSEFFFANPVISRLLKTKYYDSFLKALEPNLTNSNFVNLLTVMNVHNIVVRHDLDASFVSENLLTQPDYITTWKHLSAPKRVGMLTVVPIANNWRLERVYIVPSAIFQTNLVNVVDEITSDRFDPHTVAVTNFDIQSPMVLPKYRITKISNTKYRLTILDAQGPFLVVLSDTFNDNWVLKSTVSVPHRHVLANGFANGWVIYKTGKYEFTLVFDE